MPSNIGHGDVGNGRRGGESREEVIDSFRESAVPISDAEKEAMRQGRGSSDVAPDEADVGEILCG